MGAERKSVMKERLMKGFNRALALVLGFAILFSDVTLLPEGLIAYATTISDPTISLNATSGRVENGNLVFIGHGDGECANFTVTLNPGLTQAGSSASNPFYTLEVPKDMYLKLVDPSLYVVEVENGETLSGAAELTDHAFTAGQKLKISSSSITAPYGTTFELELKLCFNSGVQQNTSREFKVAGGYTTYCASEVSDPETLRR